MTNRQGFVSCAKRVPPPASATQTLPRFSIWAEAVRITFTRWSSSKGKRLRASLSARPLKAKPALEIVTQVATGLAAVHKKGLVHRDIKPSNIMVSSEEEGALTAKIIDLGLAKAMNESLSQAAISAPGVFVGTPEFASPEQFAGVAVDIRSDLYSLGVVLWEMVPGA